MKLTEQQSLVLFDIAKTAMNVKGGFAGYSNEDIMRLINDIISQQNNSKINEVIKKNRVIPKVPKSELSQLHEGYQPNESKDTDFWDY